MFHPRCSTIFLILERRVATALKVMVVVVGGSTGVIMLIWIPDGEKVWDGEGLSGTRGNKQQIWNQAWWWCNALCDY